MSKEKIKFSRIGGLSPVIQKAYTLNEDERNYHTPPAKKGIYAFVYPHFNPFLLGGSCSSLNKKNKHEKFEYLKDSNGNKIKLYENDYNFSKGYNKFYERPINKLLKKYLVKGKYGNFKRNTDAIEISNKFWMEDILDDDGYSINSYLVHKKKLRVFEYEGVLWHHLKNSAVKNFEIIEEIGYWIKTEYNVFVRAYKRDAVEHVKNFKKGYLVEDNNNVNTKNIYRYIVTDYLEVFIERVK